jgi:hypothetical protein
MSVVLGLELLLFVSCSDEGLIICTALSLLLAIWHVSNAVFFGALV